MRLPEAERAVVSEEKIRNYLLSLTHPEGRSKARFFASFGFAGENWQDLQAALRSHALRLEAVLSKRNEYGTFYEIDGPIPSPDGRNPALRSVWVIEEEGDPPRLITAHPIDDERT